MKISVLLGECFQGKAQFSSLHCLTVFSLASKDSLGNSTLLLYPTYSRMG